MSGGGGGVLGFCLKKVKFTFNAILFCYQFLFIASLVVYIVLFHPLYLVATYTHI